MTIYLSHSRSFDFTKDLYSTIQNSELAKKHKFIYPHENSEEPYPVKDLFQKKACDLVIAEISYPSTGQGIELGWADAFGIPVVCIYKKGFSFSGSLKVVSDRFIQYGDEKNLVEVLISSI